MAVYKISIETEFRDEFEYFNKLLGQPRDVKPFRPATPSDNPERPYTGAGLPQFETDPSDTRVWANKTLYPVGTFAQAGTRLEVPTPALVVEETVAATKQKERVKTSQKKETHPGSVTIALTEGASEYAPGTAVGLSDPILADEPISDLCVAGEAPVEAEVETTSAAEDYPTPLAEESALPAEALPEVTKIQMITKLQEFGQSRGFTTNTLLEFITPITKGAKLTELTAEKRAEVFAFVTKEMAEVKNAGA